MANKIKLAMLGGSGHSLIGILHRVAANMYDRYQLVGGAFSSNYDTSLAFANQLGLDHRRVYPNLDDFLAGEADLPAEERVEAVSILTPNAFHYEMAKKLIQHGYHVICEKPLTTTTEQANELIALSKESNKVFAVTYTYTGYPMARQMRQMIADGVVGKIQKIDVQYYQGWINPIIHDANKRANTWRLQPEVAGISCCIGDIGTHGFDMIEYLTGMEVQSLLADLNYLYDDNPVDIDGTVLLRFAENVKGVLRASQIATGEENNFQVNIYGEDAALKWEQENPNSITMLRDGQPKVIYTPGNPYLSPVAQDASKLPAGHPEGIFDAMGNIYKGVARTIRGEQVDAMEFPTLEAGARGVKFVEKVVESHKSGNQWVSM